MRYRRQDGNGDYVFGHGGQDFLVNSPICVAQAVRTALLLIQGEWFLDALAGVAWMSKIIGVNTSTLYDTVIKNCIRNVQGVRSIVSYSSTLTGMSLVVNVTVDTIYSGQAIIESIGIPIPQTGGWGAGGYGAGGYGV